jgi:hypothetical protein
VRDIANPSTQVSNGRCVSPLRKAALALRAMIDRAYEQEARSLIAPTETPPRRGRRLASGPQLYVLNRAGRLQLREPELENEISSELADLAIRRSIEEAADVDGPAEANS